MSWAEYLKSAGKGRFWVRWSWAVNWLKPKRNKLYLHDDPHWGRTRDKYRR